MFSIFICLVLAADIEETTCPVKPVTDQSVLSDKSKRIVDRLKNAPTTVNGKVYVMKFDPKKVSKNMIINVDKGIGPFYLNNCEIENVKDATHVNLNDNVKGKTLSLTIMRDAVIGMLYYDNKVYSLEPLEDGYVAIIQVDQTKFKDHP